MNKIYLALVSLVCILALDAMYIMFVSKNMFNTMMRAIQGTAIQPKYLAIAVTYLFIFLSYFYFIILKHGSIQDAFVLGVTTYAIYELTNYSLITKWSPQVVLIDTLWGGILFALTRWLTDRYY